MLGEFVSQIVEMQILDFQTLHGLTPCALDARRRVVEHFPCGFRAHPDQHVTRCVRQRHISLCSILCQWQTSDPACQVDVLPVEPDDLPLPHSCL